MSSRLPFSELTWRDKPVADCTRDELLELVEVLHGVVWDSAENFERLLKAKFNDVAGHA